MAETKMNDAGVHASAMAGLHLYEQAARRSGRTHQMIMSLQEGAAVISHDTPREMERMIRTLRGVDFAKTVRVRAARTFDGVYRALDEIHRQRPTMVAIDHHLILHLYQQHLDWLKGQLDNMGVQPHPFGEAHRHAPPVSIYGGRGHG